MSCSHVIDTYTNARFLYRGVNSYRQRFTCGKCAGCQSKQRTDWRVRTYYESLDCLKDGNNFVLFDTLTYKDDAIKRYSDIFPIMDIPRLLDAYCFSRSDVQKFFKRLRINLKRAGYKFSSQQFRYILSSEYGTSEETNGFKNTHRPHYHILFFVRGIPISPVELSRHISRAWTLGKTDGVRPYDDCKDCPLRSYCRGNCLYQSPQYVENERVVRTGKRQNVMKCVNYVTKYISKDMYMSDELQRKVDSLFYNINPKFREDYHLYKFYRRFCGQVLPFHLQSQSFGWALMRSSERDYVMRTNQVHLPTGKSDVVRSVALPRYYQRRLYYSYVKVDGKVKWYLTEDGLDYRVNQLDSKIDAFKRDYSLFDSHLSSSMLHDLAVYNLVYRGTLTDFGSLMLPYKRFYRKRLQPHSQHEQPLYYNYNTKRDKLTIGSFLSSRYVVSSDGEIIYKGKQLHKEFMPYDGYVIVNDKVCPFWIGFDAKLKSFERWRKDVAIANDVVQYEADRQVDYYKCLGLIPR